jgi:hypothetical protein
MTRIIVLFFFLRYEIFMRKSFFKKSTACLLFFVITLALKAQKQIAYCGSPANDLIVILKKDGFVLRRFPDIITAVNTLSEGSGLLILADGYPSRKNMVNDHAIVTAGEKHIQLYIEYASSLAGLGTGDSVKVAQLERAVITGENFGDHLKPMELLSINDCHYLPATVDSPLIVLARVAGFDKAEYGLSNTEFHPILYTKGNIWVATTKLTNFKTGRYGPAASWKLLWEQIIGRMTGQAGFHFSNWLSDVTPMYGENEILPVNARRLAISKGADWFYKGRFFVHPEWKKTWLHYQGDGTNPVGPPISQKLPGGNGSLGILEGHASRIYYDGSEQYRYWVRNDVQGEVAFALAAVGSLLKKDGYFKTSDRLGDYIFRKSNLRGGARSDNDSAVYGLVGWSVTHPYVFYGDDNARSTLGLIGASAFMNSSHWDKEIAENILANFRTSSKQGFRGDRLDQEDIEANGWQYYGQRDLINPHPHFESWMWACYLWLYDKTGYEPLLRKTETAIRLTMEAYPDNWKWTNGIQQERARMILPLAWLVRVDDSKEHRAWLDTVVNKLLENQVPCGAIREELGNRNGMFGSTKSNAEYGLTEAPLIFKNGDPVADMLYTSNFAFFSLNEAAAVTNNPKYKTAVLKLSDFLTRIQVRSNKHPDLDGAWFRAFDYNRWDYWASNADAGWGAWSTLTGWIQSWITATQVLVEKKQDYWTVTKNSHINSQMPETLKLMLGK